MRVLSTVLLALAAGAAAEGPPPDLQTLLGPLSNFTGEDFDAAKDALMQCAGLPGLYKDLFSMQQCRMGGKETLEVTGAEAVVVAKQFYGDAHGPVAAKVEEVLTTYLADFVKRKTHEFQAQLCDHAECPAMQRQLHHSLFACEAGYMCGLLQAEGGSKVAFHTCKAAFQKGMLGVIDALMAPNCEFEPFGAAVKYCPELLMGMLLKDAKCYMQMFAPQQDQCPEACRQTWASMKVLYPWCSQEYMASLSKMRTSISAMAQALDPTVQPAPPGKSFDENCGKDVIFM